MSTVDAVVIGSGHNGLIAANYLADAGLTVRVLERRHIVGGATVTEEVFPGYRASTASYLSGLLHPKILADLRLDEWGLRFLQGDAGTTNIWRDGRHVTLFNDLGATLRELERVGPGEGERFLAFGLQLQKLYRVLSPFLITTRPPSLAEVVAAFADAGVPEVFTDFFTLSVAEILDRHFGSDILKGLLAFTGTVSVYGGPTTPGWAYVYGHHAIGEYDGHMGQFAFPRGGMGAISGALADRAQARGAVISVDSEVARVLTRNGRVTGVVTTSGEEVASRVVLSNADPRTTYLGLVAPEDLPDELLTRMRGYDVRGAMARSIFALDRPPTFVGLGGVGPRHSGLTLLGADVDLFTRVGEAQARGRIAEDFPIELIIQTVLDDSLAPAGKHILTTGIQQVPYELAGSDWATEKKAFEERVVAVLETYAPGIRDSIIASKTITPAEYERDFGLAGANIFHGALTLGQLFDARPVPGYGGYRAPLHGLYLGGSGTHPGGGVMGVPGHNAAHAVLEDRFATAAPPDRPARPMRTPLVERALAHPALRRIGARAARDPRLARIVNYLSSHR
ncbi:phytoene desaturase family protein [Pseudonocardia acaciae]|uniref:phytoene desaturase family protein n=1 Tax=Pseudonocardia acaciae TaxID=551276 RepID=UPI0006888DB9|nr:NAD(P)/FAD-dependent oxidoreductase [Pseudonocardia acaciae]